MGLLSFITKKSVSKQAEKVQPVADFYSFSRWSGQNMVPFDGEKTPYELGTPKNYYLDYYNIRARSWEAFLKSDIIQNAIKKYCLWIVGPGLKLQADPVEKILENNKITINNEDFTANAEAYFRLYAKMKESSYSMELNLHDVANEALKNALLSGDVLCVQRVSDGRVNIETIDGYYVQDPIGNDYYKAAENRGNKIVEGVEINKKGSHVAYYIIQENFKYERILAKGKKTGRRVAWLFYGLKYKTNSVRGMSLLTAILETASKMDRYKDAALGSAEENAKIPYHITHNQFSDGENPMLNQLAQSMGKGKGVAPETDSFASCEAIATKVAQTTNKQTYNMPIGSDLKRNNFESDINFKDFFSVNSDIVYATLGIPPEVAVDKFGGAYSGSRAALKSWEYKMMTDRINLLEEQFYKPFYSFWLDVQILNNTIRAEGYLQAYMSNNTIVLAAYRYCRFIGATVPHIDPLKEINAERGKLGGQLKNIPLTTAEQACEALNTGDYLTVLKKAEIEKELSEEFIKVEEVDNNKNNDNED